MKHNTLVDLNIKILINRHLCYTIIENTAIYEEIESNIYRARTKKLSTIEYSLYYFPIENFFKRLLDD